VIPAPGTGAVTVILPVGTAHVGCVVTLAVGAAGAVGTALTVRAVGAETQVLLVIPLHYRAPGVSPAKRPVALVTGATTGAVPVTV